MGIINCERALTCASQPAFFFCANVQSTMAPLAQQQIDGIDVPGYNVLRIQASFEDIIDIMELDESGNIPLDILCVGAETPLADVRRAVSCYVSEALNEWAVEETRLFEAFDALPKQQQNAEYATTSTFLTTRCKLMAPSDRRRTWKPKPTKPAQFNNLFTGIKKFIRAMSALGDKRYDWLSDNNMLSSARVDEFCNAYQEAGLLAKLNMPRLKYDVRAVVDEAVASLDTYKTTVPQENWASHVGTVLKMTSGRRMAEMSTARLSPSGDLLFDLAKGNGQAFVTRCIMDPDVWMEHYASWDQSGTSSDKMRLYMRSKHSPLTQLKGLMTAYETQFHGKQAGTFTPHRLRNVYCAYLLSYEEIDNDLAAPTMASKYLGHNMKSSSGRNYATIVHSTQPTDKESEPEPEEPQPEPEPQPQEQSEPAQHQQPQQSLEQQRDQPELSEQQQPEQQQSESARKLSYAIRQLKMKQQEYKRKLEEVETDIMLFTDIMDFPEAKRARFTENFNFENLLP